MFNNKRKSLFKLLLGLMGMFCVFKVEAQNNVDTVALLKEFNIVMGFTIKPNLFYSTHTKTTSIPVLQETDTLSFSSLFYKSGTNIYSTNSLEEIMLQDSLWVQINHKRKSILIKRVDVASKERLNDLPFSKKQMQSYFKNNFTIKKELVDKQIARFIIVTKQKDKPTKAEVNVTLTLEYKVSTQYPTQMIMDISMQEPFNTETIAALNESGINTKEIIQKIGDTDWIVRKQRLSVRFTEISTDKIKTTQMPTLKEKIVWAEKQQEFNGVGVLADYTVSKTF